MTKKIFFIFYFVFFYNTIASEELYFLKNIRNVGSAQGKSIHLAHNNPANIAGVYKNGTLIQYRQYNSNWHYLQNSIIFFAKNISFFIHNNIFFSPQQNISQKYYFNSGSFAIGKKIQKLLLGVSVEYTHKIENIFHVLSTNIGIIYPIIQRTNNVFLRKLQISIQMKANYNIANKKFDLFFITGLYTKLWEWKNKFAMSIKLDIIIPSHFFYLPLSLGLSLEILKNFVASVNFHGNRFFQFENIFFSFLFQYQFRSFHLYINNSNKVTKQNQKTSVAYPNFTLGFYHSPHNKKNEVHKKIPKQKIYFSPNGDGIQDYANMIIDPNVLPKSNYNIYIENEQKNKVFYGKYTKEKNFLWDGKNFQNKPSSDGNYYVYLHNKQKEYNESFGVAQMIIDTKPPQASYTIHTKKITKNSNHIIKKKIFIQVQTKENLLHAKCKIYDSKRKIVSLQKKKFQQKKEVLFQWTPTNNILKNSIYYFTITVKDHAGNSTILQQKQDNFYINKNQNTIENQTTMILSKQYLSPIELFYKGILVTLQNPVVHNSSYSIEFTKQNSKVFFTKQFNNQSILYRPNSIFRSQKIYVRLIQIDKESKKFIDNKTVIVDAFANEKNFLLEKDIFFEANQEKFSKKSYRILEKLYNVILQKYFCNIQIRGHIHHVRKNENYNYGYSLSLRRANKVKQYLLEQGFHKHHFSVQAVGAKEQKSLENPFENRRAGIQIECLHKDYSKKISLLNKK